MSILGERCQLLVYGPLGAVQLPGVVLGTMTNNINGHEKVDFTFMWSASVDQLPIGLNYGVAVIVPSLGGIVAWEGFVYDISGAASATGGDTVTYTVTCFGLQNDVKTEVPSASFVATGFAPEVIAARSELLGVLNTVWNTPAQAAVVTASGNTINYTNSAPNGYLISEVWETLMQHGDGATARWDWAVWCNPDFGLRSTAKRAEVHFEKRNTTTAAYVVSREQIADNTTLTRSMDQVWSSAVFKHSTGGTANVVTATASPVPAFPRYHIVSGTSTALNHVYVADLGLPAGGSTPTGSQLSGLAAARLASELSYRFSSTPIAVMPDSIRDAVNTGTPIPNELVRPGRLLQIRNFSARARQGVDINLFITQTSLDLKTGILTLTPQSSKDWASNMAILHKRKGSTLARTVQ